MLKIVEDLFITSCVFIVAVENLGVIARLTDCVGTSVCCFCHHPVVNYLGCNQEFYRRTRQKLNNYNVNDHIMIIGYIAYNRFCGFKVICFIN